MTYVAKFISDAEHEKTMKDNMIEITVRFWAGNMNEEKKILPRHAWTCGSVTIEKNEAHGITQCGNPKPFASLLEISTAIEQVLLDHGIVLHTSHRMNRYLSDE